MLRMNNQQIEFNANESLMYQADTDELIENPADGWKQHKEKTTTGAISLNN